MRYGLGFVAMIGTFLSLFSIGIAIGADRFSARLDALLILGVVLMLVALVWSVLLRGSERSDDRA